MTLDWPLNGDEVTYMWNGGLNKTVVVNMKSNCMKNMVEKCQVGSGRVSSPGKGISPG
jgi:hypothetical protein